jgi:hypothetical protein
MAAPSAAQAAHMGVAGVDTIDKPAYILFYTLILLSK